MGIYLFALYLMGCAVVDNHPFATDNEQFADEYDELFGNALKVVEISEYRPYYTNGMPDPTPEEYDDDEIEDALWDVERVAMSSGHKFQMVDVGFQK